ncbi:SIS domain-containing protein [Mycetohabitans endofungorum]|uniref:SIS domain-containing protein n=1 Tax=Mycetohabitans endofungorum TaxID=417203 RepID=UPI002B059C94|nr:SIS domain-containing protein [Mycetohabitans endofungorum]
MSIERIQRQFRESAELQLTALDALGVPIAAAIDAMFATLANGGKILACGDGACASDAQRFAAALVGRFERERPGLPALALANDDSMRALGGTQAHDEVFARQVRSLGHGDDILLAIGVHDEAPALVAAIDAAHEREMIVVALTGAGGGPLTQSLTDIDIHICVPAQRHARVHELQLLTIHCLCDGIDAMLLGEED